MAMADNGQQTLPLFCPHDGCPYSSGGRKFFKRKMVLDHHIANVHAEKELACEKCGKKYAMHWQLKYHQKSCGVSWMCQTCGKAYFLRTSLLVHCKRTSHQLPAEARMRPKNEQPAPVNVILLPIIVQPTVKNTQRLILPKIEPEKMISDCSMQTESLKSACNCSTNTNKPEAAFKDKSTKTSSISTQTERVTCKNTKPRESRSAQCPPIKRNRKLARYESAETQTTESTLDCLSSQNIRLKISASTSTSPPKRGKRKSISTDCLKQTKRRCCVFTQTDSKVCDSQNQTVTEDSDLLMTNFLLGQPTSSCNLFISEQSVQTESINESDELVFENTIQTQTAGFNTEALIDFDPDLFSDLECTDIETQTNWNSDGTTQTEDNFDEIDIVIKQYLNSEALFTDTQTQTHLNLPQLICSYSQTPNINDLN